MDLSQKCHSDERVRCEGSLYVNKAVEGRSVSKFFDIFPQPFVSETLTKLGQAAIAVEKKESIARIENRRAQEELRLDIEDRETKQKNAARLASIDASDKEMWSMVKMQIEMATQKNDREMSRRRQDIDAEFRKMQSDIEDRYQQRKLKLDESLARMGLMERLVSQGLNVGAADASVLKTMLQQMTEQEYATTTDAMVKSRSEAQAGGNNLDTYRQAQADERQQQIEMTRLSAELMQAAKQPVAPIIVAALTCKHCSAEIQAKWRACPACGNPL